ncbi:hypothetical protein DM01DRAFT_1408340 [Hesseltinella vesiculosa]|uniref:HAD-like protein n=1 Tax=Hesseltinella vesiculosa TaxID=101127 RepID=A0A1X2GFF8_9FUNG|nr:hypothetical protein DM01DRAFT_1408340 [Hesseltinella vesiculosa]
MKRSKNKVIAVEIDQILARTLDAFLGWHNELYDTQWTLASLKSRDLSKAFHTKSEGCAKLRDFYDSKHFCHIQPIDNGQATWGALEVLQTLKKRKWKLVIITCRPQFTSVTTQRFIDRHFPGIFDAIYYCNQGLSVADQLDFVPKPVSIMCQEIGADYLIDDALEHCMDCSSLDMTLLLYDHDGEYAYNHMVPKKRPRNGRPTLTATSRQLYQQSPSGSLPENVARVKSWKAILDLFPMPSSPLRHCHYPSKTSLRKRRHSSMRAARALARDDNDPSNHDDDRDCPWTDRDPIAV